MSRIALSKVRAPQPKDFSYRTPRICRILAYENAAIRTPAADPRRAAACGRYFRSRSRCRSLGYDRRADDHFRTAPDQSVKILPDTLVADAGHLAVKRPIEDFESRTSTRPPTEAAVPHISIRPADCSRRPSRSPLPGTMRKTQPRTSGCNSGSPPETVTPPPVCRKKGRSCATRRRASRAFDALPDQRQRPQKDKPRRSRRKPYSSCGRSGYPPPSG